MRHTFVFLLLLFTACPELIGDRCAPDLPPCPELQVCIDSRCRVIDAGSAGGGVAGGQTGGGAVAGGSGGGALDASADAGDGIDGGGSDGGGGLDAGRDAGQIDAGQIDAGQIDAGQIDAGQIDAGQVDAGQIDAGQIDAGQIDAGQIDAGQIDAGPVDAGVTCVPACSASTECVNAACMPRYAGLAVTIPRRTNRPLVVTAQLGLIPGRSSNPPPSLPFVATFDGGGFSEQRVGSLAPYADGGFGLDDGGLLSARSGAWAVVVSFVDAGLVGSSVSEIDLSPPELLVSWPPAPPRVAIPGGLDFRDPLDPIGSSSRSRHGQVPVTVQSGSPDISQVEVGLAGLRTNASTGTNCSADGGFCRVVVLSLADPPLLGVRATFPIEAIAQDDLGNRNTLDAGAVSVSRWRFSFDGGSPGQNDFSVSVAGELIFPKATTNEVIVIRPDGTRLATWNTQLPPVNTVPVGQVQDPSRGRLVYVLQQQGGNSRGESYSLSTPSDAPELWAVPLNRPWILPWPIVRTSPATGTEEVVALFNDATTARPAASWAATIRPAGLLLGTRVAASTFPALAGGTDWAVASGALITASDGRVLYGFRGASGTDFISIEERSSPFTQTLGSLSPVVLSVAGSAGNVLGLGRSAGATFLFDATFPGSFTQSAASSPSSPTSIMVLGGGAAYFVLTGPAAAEAHVCRATLSGSSFLCSTGTNEPLAGAVALGQGDVLYDLAFRQPSMDLVLEVRVASTLALMWEAPFMTTAWAWGLTATCIGGVPLVGAIDADGRAVFFETDSRGPDPAADWPMSGHDPSRTRNASTPLTPYLCP